MPDAAVTALLELDGVTKSFGRVVVADRLSLTAGAGDIVGIVGPNGAGKTSLFGLITGDLAPQAGVILLDGSDVTRLDPASRCRLGIGRTYQVPRPFGAMTVFENVLVSVQQGAGLRRRASYAAAAEVLERTGLSADANSPAERLGLLQRKRLELARALGSGPRLLLLDEVAGGLTDPEVEELVGIVRSIRGEGVAIIWIEHVVRALTAAVERLLCLAGGSFVSDGTPAAVLADPAVREVFLGTEVTTSLGGGLQGGAGAGGGGGAGAGAGAGAGGAGADGGAGAGAGGAGADGGAGAGGAGAGGGPAAEPARVPDE